MIAVLLAISIAAAPAHVIEVPIAGTDFVSIAAVCPLPQLDPLGRAAADVLAQVVTNDNDSYTKQEMRDLCIPGGAPRCYAMADHMTIELSVLPADTGAGMRMLAAMVSTARMQVDVMNAYLLTEPYRHKAVWSLGLDDQDRAWDRLRVTDISGLYHYVFRPDNITIAAGGDVRAGAPQSAWNEASQRWVRQHATIQRQGVPFKDFPRVYPSHVLELRGPEVSPADPKLAAKILALIALGGGKSSSLFMDIRETRAISYRQEAILWPTLNGFVPRLLFQIKPLALDDELKQIEEIRKDLLEDIDKWDVNTLARAKGFGSIMATTGMELGPLYFRPTAPLSSSVEDQTVLAAYWRMKTGTNWDGDAMSEAFTAVDLPTLKEQAAGMLGVSLPVVHPAPKEG